LWEQERQLQRQHADEWLGKLRPLAGVHWSERGLTRVALDVDDLLSVPPQTWAEAEPFVWVDFVRLCQVRAGDFSRLARAAQLDSLTGLSLWDNGIGPESLRVLTESPHLAGLRHLDLHCNRIGNEGVPLLANSPHLARLTTLDLRGNGIQERAAAVLRRRLGKGLLLDRWGGG
jgi:hypothetical protein